MEARLNAAAPTVDSGGEPQPAPTPVAAASDPSPVSPAAPTASESAPGFEGADSATVWPDEAAEAAFIAETRGRGETVRTPAAPPAIEADEADSKPLPSLDQLVKRIPAGTMELLDELFRARFTAVRRIKKADLKN